MRGFGIKLAVLAAVLLAARVDAEVINFDNLPEGKVVQSSDLPVGYTISVNNRNSNHPDKGIIFDSDCPPGNVGSDCSGQDPDLITPGPGVGNDQAQHKILIIAEDDVDTSPPDGYVDDPDDEACGGTVTFTIPEHCELKSLRLIDIECNEEKTKVILDLANGGTQEIPAVTLGNNSAQTITVPHPIPDIDGFTVDCEGSCAIDDIVLDCCNPPTTTTTTCTTSTTDQEDVTTTTATVITVTITITTTSTTTSTTIGKFCGDGVLDDGEDCDEGEDNSNAPDATCRLDCTLQRCGDGIVDTGEQCDAGASNSNAPNAPCRLDCTLPYCGDGILDTIRGEQCDPPPKPDAENCANQLDDDNDGLVDCADPDCPALTQKCGFDCKLAMCTPVRRDPAIIRFGAGRSGTDMFWIHGNFRAAQDVDFTKDPFAIMLSNAEGLIYQGTLVPGEFKKKVNGKGRYVFRDRDARANGQGDADGIYRVSMREKVENGYVYAYFRFRAFGDFSAATLPRMTLQIAAGNHVGTITADWRQTGSGWVLKQRDFGDLE